MSLRGLCEHGPLNCNKLKRFLLISKYHRGLTRFKAFRNQKNRIFNERLFDQKIFW